MSHELETFADGSAAFVSARQSAWHRLGTVTAGCLTAEEAMRAAYLAGWNVRKLAMTATELTPNGVNVLEVADHYATARTNPKTGRAEILGVVGSDYHPIQNEQNCEFLDLLVDQAGAHFETAGSLRGGRQTFVTMKLPQTMRLAGVDDLELNLAALNSHDGSSKFRVIVTPVRIVCANTQRMALRHAQSEFAVRHTAGATARVAEARQILRLTWAYAEAFEAEARRLVEQPLTDTQFTAVVDTLWQPPKRDASARARTLHRNRSNQLAYLFNGAGTQAGIRGTRWAGLQAITEYLDHYSPAPAVEARASRVILGRELAATKQRAYELLAVT
ncbi:MAG: DUF932 domain-containing protein [Sporichthyaceae bacterium]|nr:DUF932 domain-containing protein [Sporichthyaceae bacterium]